MVQGLTTAAALGIAVGAGFYAEATMTTIVLMLILVALRPIERWLRRGRPGLLGGLGDSEGAEDEAAPKL